MYKLICMSFDGEYVCECERETIDECRERSGDMGSRWFFYPFHFVVTANESTVRAAPTGLEHFEGKRVGTVVRIFKALAAEPDMADADVDDFHCALCGVRV